MTNEHTQLTQTLKHPSKCLSVNTQNVILPISENDYSYENVTKE